MADTEDIAKALTDYVVDSEYLNMHVPSIQRKMHDIVYWLIPNAQMEDIRLFVRRMKAQDKERMNEKAEKQHWIIDPNKASSEHHLQLRDDSGWHSATAKWDGCIDLWKYHNVPLDSRTNKPEDEYRELDDYIHYCNIDEEIARLQALKKIATEYFSQHGPGGYWKDGINSWKQKET